jgi:VanZ family protein
MNKQLLYARAFLIFFCLAILAGSSIPGDQIPKGFQLTPDKLIHCVEYFILGVLIYRWLLIEFTINKIYLLFLITLVLGSLFGAIDENYQRLTPGRTPDRWDWVLDTIGALLAAVAGYFIWSRKIKKPR